MGDRWAPHLLDAAAAALAWAPGWVRAVGGGLIGALWFFILPIRRGVGMDNLKASFPQRGALWRGWTLLRVGACLGRGALETLATAGRIRRGWPGRIRWEGLGHLDAAMASGRGVLLLTAHLGPWEVALMEGAQLIAQRGGRPGGASLLMPVRPARSPGLWRWLEEARGRAGARGIPEGGPTMGRLLQRLRAGGAVALPLDQRPGGRQRGQIRFLGRDAPVSPLAASLAARSGARVLLVSCVFSAGGILGRIEPAPLPSDPRGPSRRAAQTAAWTRAIERLIVAHPTQWLWLHRRWG